MKKLLSVALIASILCISMPSQAAKAREPGGLGAGLVGCCFGIRAGVDFNDNQNVGIRDVLDLLWIGRIWSFITCYSGVTRSDLHSQEPLYY